MNRPTKQTGSNQKGKEMKKNQIQTILEFYDRDHEFQKNDRYSDRSQSVYTKPDDNSHWLVAIPHDNNCLEIHQTDEHGIITAKDHYESKGNTVSCLSVERLQERSQKMIAFTLDEINMIYQYGENGKPELLAMLNEILPVIKDAYNRSIVRQTIDKISSLSQEVCSALISSVRCRKLYERDCSVRERLAKASQQSKQSTTNGQKIIRKGRDEIR